MSHYEKFAEALERSRHEWKQYDERCEAAIERIFEAILNNSGFPPGQVHLAPVRNFNPELGYSAHGVMDRNTDSTYSFAVAFKVPGFVGLLVRLTVRCPHQKAYVKAERLDRFMRDGDEYEISTDEDLEVFVSELFGAMTHLYGDSYQGVVESREYSINDIEDDVFYDDEGNDMIGG